MNPGEEIDDRRAGLDRRPVRKAGRRDQSRHRLDRQIHRQIVAVGSREAVARTRGVDEARIDLVQYLPADAEPVHDPGCEILQQHVGALDHPEQQRAAGCRITGFCFWLSIQGRFCPGTRSRRRCRNW